MTDIRFRNVCELAKGARRALVAVALLAPASLHAQDIRRVVAADTIGSHQLSIAVERGMVHFALVNDAASTDVMATPACVAAWAAVVDSTARWPVTIAPGQAAQPMTVTLAPDHPAQLGYMRQPMNNGRSTHNLIAASTGGRPVVMAMSDVQVALFTMSARLAAALADSLNPQTRSATCTYRYAVRAPQFAPTAIAPNDRRTFFAYQVEVEAKPNPHNPAPAYPPALRSTHLDGEVLAQFVVNASGEPDSATFRVLKSNNDLSACRCATCFRRCASRRQ